MWSPNAEWTVVEADEFDRSFLHLHPTHAAITSADPDHLDIYGDVASFHEGFRAFAERISGTLFLEADVHIEGVTGKRYGVTTSRQEAEAWHAAATALRIEDGWLTGDVWIGEGWHEDVRFPLAGVHNVKNALAALCLAEAAGASVEGSLQQLAAFQGIERRFAYHVRADHGIYIDDYAHHPVELEAAIAAVRLHHPGREITGIFQPHLFSRTRDNLVEFGQALAQLDRIFLLPIYPAREAPIPGIDSQALFENIPHPHKYLIESNQIFDNLKAYPPDVLMTLGAGDIDRCVQPLAHWLKEDPEDSKLAPEHTMIRTILSIASAVLLIAGSGALVGFSVERESNARYTGLEVDVVEIDGMFFVDAAGVRDRIFANDSISGTFVADLSLHDVERWVREIPAIDGVEIYPGLNRTLHVQVTQRKPLARVHTSEDEPDFYIDDEGEPTSALALLHRPGAGHSRGFIRGRV